MHTEIVNYRVESTTFKGQVFAPTADKKSPLVIVAHAWRGQDEFALEKAKALTQLGYVGFAADLYGDGKSVETNEEAQALMIPLFIDRKALRQRICAAYEVARSLPFVDSNRIGAMGFCFGGLTVVELLRSGLELRGVVSFHGVIGDRIANYQAKLQPAANKLRGSILILHGYEDPLVSPNDIDGIQKELTKAGVDWQMHIYGQTCHAFTNPMANEKNEGVNYNPVACARAMRSMQNYFEERFKQ